MIFPNMKKINVLFRTGGGTGHGKELGFGHIYRCINLANSLKYNNIHFLVEDFGNVKNILIKNKYSNIHLLKNDIDLKLDIEKSIKYLNDEKIDVFIIDRYKINKKYVSEMKKYVKTVMIADLKEKDFDVDLVINGFIGFKNEIIKNKYGGKCLVGPKYQILNYKFSEKNIKKQKNESLLATFGGFDDEKISLKLLKIILKMNLKIKIKIILGHDIKLKISDRKKISNKPIKIISNTNNMYKEMKNVKYGLCSGGITTYEFATLGIPFGIICQNKHQLITAKEWEKQKIAVNLGLSKSIKPKEIEKFILSLPTNFQKKKKINYQNGAKIVAMEITKLTKIKN
jgi:spore coat polysaccharide biosynthesis predicted glycosyltransferase SpsG